ncbi:MAG: DUF3244 domain-containing protein [Mangrovibacterium sp.]
MKRIILVCFTLLGVIGTSGNSLSTSSVNYSLDAEEEIELNGSLSEISIKSVIRPIQAFISTTELETNFLYNLGDIDVVICGEAGGVVYERSVDTSIEDQIFIDISSWDQGTYEIRFINSEGRFMYGEFEID